MNFPAWSTIESEPAIFTGILQELGVQDVKVEEIYSLDKSSFDPFEYALVYGLIFLFKWNEDANKAKAISVCENNVYFAKQIVDNACATQAVLSIVLNRDDVSIGDDLLQFKDLTRNLAPQEKGAAIGRSELLRKVHNSFTANFETENNYRREKSTKKTREMQVEYDAYHFIAYVP
ncbi:cysteine proteinase, partial [Rozella allomycis CSF55]